MLRNLQNSSKNVRYDDFVTLIKAFDFKRTRGKGSHEIYKRKGVAEIVNIQNRDGYAKPYQIEQFLSLIEKYNLESED
jgi:predicted RNA binding protein YcfA (HicA-like mRNA interferase family)